MGTCSTKLCTMDPQSAGNRTQTLSPHVAMRSPDEVSGRAVTATAKAVSCRAPLQSPLRAPLICVASARAVVRSRLRAREQRRPKGMTSPRRSSTLTTSSKSGTHTLAPCALLASLEQSPLELVVGTHVGTAAAKENIETLERLQYLIIPSSKPCESGRGVLCLCSVCGAVLFAALFALFTQTGNTHMDN